MERINYSDFQDVLFFLIGNTEQSNLEITIKDLHIIGAMLYDYGGTLTIMADSDATSGFQMIYEMDIDDSVSVKIFCDISEKQYDAQFAAWGTNQKEFRFETKTELRDDLYFIEVESW
jgi:hypothetical protein